MSFDEATYQFLSGTKMPIKKVIDSLHFVSSLREKGVINFLEVGPVVMERNFREMPDYTRRLIEEFHVDRVRLRPFFHYSTDVMGAPTAWFYDVRNPKHPYFEEYMNIMRDPIFKHPKVYKWSADMLSQDVDDYPYSQYIKDHVNFELIKYFANDERMPGRLTQYFSNKGVQKISIYGLSQTAQALILSLEKTVIEIDEIIDQRLYGNTHRGKTIISANRLPRNYSIPIVVAAPYFYNEIVSEIRVHVDCPRIFNLQDILREIGCC